MLPKVLLSEDINHLGKELLSNKAEILIAPDTSQATAIKLAQDVTGIILRATTKIDSDVLKHARELKIIARTGVGVDNVDVSAATERGILVCNFPGMNNITVAEHVVTMVMALSKQVLHMHNAVKTGNWNERFSEHQTEVGGKTIGIVGIGQIGYMVAQMCNGLGMKILAYDPYMGYRIQEDFIAFTDELGELFSKADFISVNVPGTPQTKGMINSEILALMKSSAYLINTSRGTTIDEKALIEVLKNKKIRGAALDVFCEEPLPANSPFNTLDNVILSPHCAGSTWESNVRIAIGAAQSVLDVIEGRLPDPRYIYNKEVLASR